MPTKKRYALYWVSEDGQGDLPMGEYKTEAEAEAAIPEAKAELLAQCASDEDREDIERGRWAVNENEAG